MGSQYHGYQTQNNSALTIQRVLQTALEDFYGEKLSITGCSRTDAGVHAKQFFCTVEGELKKSVPPEKIPFADYEAFTARIGNAPNTHAEA